MKKLFKLFITFFKIGAFTFGGGYAMVPLIHRELVDKQKWITDEEMFHMIAIAESTPGVIAVNSASFVGYKIGRFWGSVIATLGVVLPSLFIILIIATFFDDLLKYQYVNYIFMGIRAGVFVLILDACLRFYKQCSKTFVNFALIAIALLLSFFVEFRFMTLCLILFGFIVGIVTKSLKTKERSDVE